MKTKKHKKHKSERHEEERSDKEPLRLVLKVGESLSAHSPHHESKKHKHKKKKKKKSKDKDHHREEERPSKRHHVEESEEEMEVSQEDEDEGNISVKPADIVESDDTEHDEVEAQPPQRQQEQSRVPTPTRGDDEKGVLRICLKYLHKKMQAKDVNGFFAYPVNDMIAPGYSMIIPHPMDFSTMMAKIDNNEYKNVMDFKKDFVLMCNNAMHYNRPETIYYKEAKRLLHMGMKSMSKDKLLIMKRTLPFMASLRYEELGINEPDDTKAVMEAIVEEEKEQKQRAKDREEIGRFEAVPDNMSASEILSQAQAAARDAAEMLMMKQPNCKFGFLRRKEDGSTSMTLLNPDNDGIISKRERIISIGKLVGKLGTGAGTLTGYKEDKRNRVTPGQYLNYGPFGTYAPQYDSTFANMTKDETDILLSTYGDETGVSYAKSVLSFVEKGGDYAVCMVDNLLDILTKGEHAKTKALLEQKMKDDGGKGDKPTVISQPEVTTKVTDDNANIDFDSLRGLSDLGVDVSFLDSMEKTVKKEKDPVQEKLDQTATLLNDLQQTQNERLSQSIPAHISQIPGPSEKEIQLAQKVTKELKELAQEANPGNIASTQGLRNAIGVSYQSSDSTQSTFTSTQATSYSNTQTSLSTGALSGTSQPVSSLQSSVHQSVGPLQALIQSNQSAASVQPTLSVSQSVSSAPSSIKVNQPVISSFPVSQSVASLGSSFPVSQSVALFGTSFPGSQSVATLQSSVPVIGSFQMAANTSVGQTIQPATVFSPNIPNLITNQNIASSYQPTIAVSSALINQQAAYLQPQSISYQMPVVSASVPFQATVVSSMNQQVTGNIVGQGLQNAADMNSSVSNMNDDDSDIEMDISEFLQFPSS